MKSFFSKELLGNPLVIGAVGAVVLIAVGSTTYYIVATREPAGAVAAPANVSATQVTASGAVEPAQNPDLAFASGGRVTSVSVAVGDTVSQGEVLASLDIASLSAQRAQAQANLETQQANLAQLQAGPRQVDIDAKQTAVAQAESALADLYSSTPTTIAQAYDKSFSGISADTDTLFNQPYTVSPSLAFSTSNSQLAASAVSGRISANSTLAAWQEETASLSNSSQDALDTSLTSSLAHLSVLRDYSNALIAALNNAIPAGSFTQASLTAAQTAVGTYRDSINTEITALQSMQQQLASGKLAVESASDALNQVMAGATTQDIQAQAAQVAAAQANVENFDAQISNALIVAPFAGTVASVHVKKGDIVSANTPAVSLNPEGALQVTAYFSEIDITKVKVGATAQVTLDAYGSGRVFPAQVISVDTSPTANLGYKATLQFSKSDPAISSGMTANVIIPIQ